MSRGLYRVKIQSPSGRDGGFGPPQSYDTHASSPHVAAQKKRKKGARIISVRLLKKL